jgi:four helix bundle protein
MSKQTKFEDLDLWKEAIHLAREIHLYCQGELRLQQPNLAEKLCDTATQISLDIAVGFDRQNKKQFAEALEKARLNTTALRSMLALLHAIGHLNDEIYGLQQQLALSLSSKMTDVITFLQKKSTAVKAV